MVGAGALQDLGQQLLLGVDPAGDEARAGAWIYPSRLRFKDGKMYLLRVVVAEEHMPPVIVTAYRTSKIEKYWSAE